MRYEWKPYLKYGIKKCSERGNFIFARGKRVLAFTTVAEGKVSIRLLSEEGKERIIDYMLDGSLLGAARNYWGILIAFGCM